jgi:prevent-host-death family protein
MKPVKTLPISKVKDQLNDLVDEAANTSEQITITRNGVPAAVLVGADEWEALQETLYWLSVPDLKESLTEAHQDFKDGNVLTEEQIRSEFSRRRKK